MNCSVMFIEGDSHNLVITIKGVGMYKKIDIDENNKARHITEKYSMKDQEDDVDFLLVNYKTLLSAPNYLSNKEKAKRRMPIIHFLK